MSRLAVEDLLARRSFLVGGFGTAAAIGAFGPALVPSPAPADDPKVFAHGVASGDPLPDAVVLWTRITPSARARPGSGQGPEVLVTWEVATDADLVDVVTSGQATTGPDRDHTVKIDATGLRPATRYWYRFTWGEHESPVGCTTTAPEPDATVDHLSIGVVSCANWQAGHFTSYRHLAERDDLDLVVHLGDYLYEYEPGKYSWGHEWIDVRRHDPPRETVSLEDYRRRHAQYKTDPDLQALHARVPWVVTWDDHEVADGWWSDGAFEHQGSEGSFKARRAAAQRAYDEWMPVRLSGTAQPGDGVRMYRDLRFGGLVHLSMLDLRSYRDDRVGADDPALDDGKRSITGVDQREWLLDTLSESSAQWKLVGNPVMMAPVLMPPRPPAERYAMSQVTTLLPLRKSEPNTDTWAGFRRDRERVLDHVRDERIRDVVFLTGDVHTSWATEVETDDGTPVAGEFVCPSITSNNIDDFMGTAPRTVSLALEAAIQDVNPAVRWVNLDEHGYCVLDVTPERALMEWYAISDRRDPDATSTRVASWQVRSGTPAVVPA